MAELQAKMQQLSEDFTKLQQQMNTAIQGRQKLEAQKTENLGVETEFKKLGEGQRIFKLVGPVLVQQDRTEAESTVKGRLDFITKEISRLEVEIKEIQGKLEKKKTEIIQLQSSAQAAAAKS